MDFKVCARCGKEIEEQGVLFNKRRFCSDECCEEFEEMLLDGGGPEPEDLDFEAEAEADVDEDDLDEDLDLDDLDEDLDLDDEF